MKKIIIAAVALVAIAVPMSASAATFGGGSMSYVSNFIKTAMNNRLALMGKNVRIADGRCIGDSYYDAFCVGNETGYLDGNSVAGYKIDWSVTYNPTTHMVNYSKPQAITP